MKKVLLSTLIRTMFCLVLGSYAQAQTVLVSDIDDTLKISHVLDWADAAGNLVQMGNHFLGMSQVYNLLQEEKMKTY